MIREKLGNIVEIKKGKKVDNVLQGYKENAKRYIQIEDLRNDDNCKYTFDEGVEVSEKDIIIAWDGANAGTVSYGLNGVIGSTLAAIKLKNDVFMTELIGKFLQSNFQILRSGAYGATIPHIRRDILENLEITLPEKIDKQKKLNEIINQANSIRQKRRETLRLADEFLRSTFLEMFGDPVVNSRGLTTIKGNDLYELASGKFMPTRNLRDNYKYEVYGGNGITGFSNEYLIDKRTLVIGRVGAYCGSIHMTNEKSWITDNAIYIKKLKKDFDLVYLYYLLTFLKINRFASYSGQPKITQSPLLELELLSPEQKLQNKFSTIVEKTEQLKRKYEQSLQESQNLFNSLMQRAFRGEL